MKPAVHEARVLYRPAPEHGHLPEGVRALPDGRLSWITIQCGSDRTDGAVHVLDPARGENHTFPLPGRPGFALPTGDASVWLLGMEREVAWFDGGARTLQTIVDGIDAHTDGTIVNDAEPCRDGVIFGCKDTAFREHKAGLYFLRRRDTALFRLRDDQLCSNGKVVRELGAGRVELFDIDTPTRIVRRYELDTDAGTIDEARIAIDLRTERGVPDGMCGIPGTEDVVVAMYDPEPAAFGRALRCSLRDGRVLAEYRTPGAVQVTCPAWLPKKGGRGGTLVLTTASQELDAARLAQQPNAGCLFAVELAS